MITKAILRGNYIDKTVIVPANSTVEGGTVLGEVNTTQKLIPYKSDAADGSEEPSYVLAYDLVNDTVSDKDFSNTRVLAEGEVDAAKLKLAKEGDTVAAIATKLKNNGILVLDVQNV